MGKEKKCSFRGSTVTRLMFPDTDAKDAAVRAASYEKAQQWPGFPLRLTRTCVGKSGMGNAPRALARPHVSGRYIANPHGGVFVAHCGSGFGNYLKTKGCQRVTGSLSVARSA
jgi:hypothetical protein